jgi:hypothetical protein
MKKPLRNRHLEKNYNNYIKCVLLRHRSQERVMASSSLGDAKKAARQKLETDSKATGQDRRAALLLEQCNYFGAVSDNLFTSAAKQKGCLKESIVCRKLSPCKTQAF